MRLPDAHVVLTGASGGTGLAIAEALCSQGAKVLAASRHVHPPPQLREFCPANLHWGEAGPRTAPGRQQRGPTVGRG
ncbi:SDR family NAD(P)-dependent oxidoreductase, partial [Pseudomonas syringae]